VKASVRLVVGAALGTLGCGPGFPLPNPGGTGSDQAGFSVAMDSGWAVVGVAKGDPPPVGGRALLYQRSGSGASLQFTLLPSTPTAGAQFGWAVAVSGERAIAGAFGDASAIPAVTGGAYLFERSGATWVEVARVFGDTADGSGFGAGVAISGDYAVAGAPLPPAPTFTGPGRAFVYRRDGSTGLWVRDTALSASDGIDYIEFGRAVAIQGDLIAVGTKLGVKGGTTISGAAYVFRRQGTTWTEEAKLTPLDGEYHDFFGAAIAVANGAIVVGAKGEDSKGNEAGAAYVFAEGPPGTWTQVRKLLAPDGDAGDEFGYSVGVEGGLAIVGAWLADGDTTRAGAAYLYSRFGGWPLVTTLVAKDGAYGDGFGASVSVSAGCALVGAPNKDVGEVKDVGAAYLFCDLPPPVDAADPDIICCENFDPIGPVLFTTTVANRGSTAAIGRLRVVVVQPDGLEREIVGATSVTLGAGQTIEQRHVWRPPPGTPAGTFELRLTWEQEDGISVERATFARTSVSEGGTGRARATGRSSSSP
jgi:hypothetical protein